MEFQQSQTYKNIASAYDRELTVSTLYSIYADRAAFDGYIEISEIYNVINRNEKEHARVLLRRFNDGVVPPTQANLLTSAQIELAASSMYQGFAKTAQEEGFPDIAALFNGLTNIELNHNLIFQSNYNNVVTDQVFCKPEATLWICMQCGNIMSGTCAPDICPVCSFPQGYYKVFTNTDL